MHSDSTYILEKALDRERRARRAAEKLLEDKSKELYDALLHLKEANGRLETLLKQEGKSLDSAFVNLIDPYVVMDLSTRIISMNSSAKEFLGYDNDEEEVVLSNLVHPDYREYTNQSFRKLVHVGVLKNYNARIVTKAKLEKYVNINASLIYNKQGTPVAAQGVIRDITSEMEVKRLMATQKKQLDIIVENSSIGILLIAKDKIVMANQAICDMLGYQEYELKKLSLEDISTIEDISQFEKILDLNDAENSNSIKVTRKFQKKYSGFIYGKTSIKSLYHENGQLQYNVVMVEDVTTEKLAKDKLTASEERMASMIGNLQTGLLFEDNNRKLLMTNQRFLELFAIAGTVEDLKGKDAELMLQEYKKYFADEEGFINSTQALIEQGKVVTGQELELLGGRILTRDYIPLFTDDELSGHLWSYNDITLQKNYRRNLEQQKRNTAILLIT